MLYCMSGVDDDDGGDDGHAGRLWASFFYRNSPTPLGASSASFRSFLVPVLPGECLSTRSVTNLGFRVEGFRVSDLPVSSNTEVLHS